MGPDLSAYQKLTDTEHILLRPNMYLGSADETEVDDYFLVGDKFVQKTVTYIPGLVKIINEIIDNSIDEAVRTGFKFANRISIKVDDVSVRVTDNGRGIPVELMKGTKEYIPVVLFTEAKAGSNFKDDNRTTIGMNGIGSTITNVFSKKFVVATADGKNKLVMTCEDNNGKESHKITPSTKQGTDIYFEPDLKRFKLSKISDIYKEVLRQRLYFLSISYPEIKFTFNDEKIKSLTEASFIAMFSDVFEYFKDDNYFFAITLSDSDDFRFFTYVNGLYIKDGGNHINYLASEVVNRIRDKLEKKYKSIKPGDIKNKLRVIAFLNNFPNPKYNSQTKENLTNSAGEVKEYFGEIDFDKFVKAVLKNEEILNAIEENYKIKEEFQKRKELSQMSKPTKKVHIEKYLPSIDNNKYLTLAEGDSASSGLLPILGRKDFGYFSLKGKPLNVEDIAISKLSTNEELKNIINILGIDISKEVKDMSFEHVLIASDQDLDGILIRGLLLTFFNKYTPDLIKQGRIKYLKTPMIYLSKKGVPIFWFFTFTEFNQWQEKNDIHGYEFHYMKGLGSWKAEVLKAVIEKDSFDKFVETFEYDKTAQDYIKKWMSDKTSDDRKEFLRGLSFDIERL